MCAPQITHQRGKRHLYGIGTPGDEIAYGKKRARVDPFIGTDLLDGLVAKAERYAEPCSDHHQVAVFVYEVAEPVGSRECFHLLLHCI